MVLVHFRLTDDSSVMLDSAVSWFRSVSVVWMAVYETSKLGKLHIHCILEVINKSTFVQQFHKQFKDRWKGNKSYSCELLKKDIENNMVYCCKGTRFKEPDVIFTLKSKEEIHQYWLKYWEDKPIEEDKTLVTPKRKSTIESWSEKVTKEIRNLYPERHWAYDAEDINILIDIVLQKLGQNSKKLNSHIVHDLVLGQLNALTYGNSISLKNKLKIKSFPDLFGEA